MTHREKKSRCEYRVLRTWPSGLCTNCRPRAVISFFVFWQIGGWINCSPVEIREVCRKERIYQDAQPIYSRPKRCREGDFSQLPYNVSTPFRLPESPWIRWTTLCGGSFQEKVSLRWRNCRGRRAIDYSYCLLNKPIRSDARRARTYLVPASKPFISCLSSKTSCPV